MRPTIVQSAGLANPQVSWTTADDTPKRGCPCPPQGRARSNRHRACATHDTPCCKVATRRRIRRVASRSSAARCRTLIARGDGRSERPRQRGTGLAGCAATAASTDSSSARANPSQHIRPTSWCASCAAVPSVASAKPYRRVAARAPWRDRSARSESGKPGRPPERLPRGLARRAAPVVHLDCVGALRARDAPPPTAFGARVIGEASGAPACHGALPHAPDCSLPPLPYRSADTAQQPR